MKIQAVVANNKKRCFVIKTRGGTYEYPFSRLRLKPSAADPIVHVERDPEIAYEGFRYKFCSGKGDTIHIEQVLEYSKDPAYQVEQILYQLTIQAQDLIKLQGARKRELARKLNTSPTQLYRLLDQKFYGKTIDQMIRLLHALGHSVKVLTEKAA